MSESSSAARTSGANAAAAAWALLGAWSTAVVFGELVLHPVLGVRSSLESVSAESLGAALLGWLAFALMFGTPFAVVAFFGVRHCLRTRRGAVAVPLLFAGAWAPVLVCACVARVGIHWLPVACVCASWLGFTAAGAWIARSSHPWLAPRDTRVA